MKAAITVEREVVITLDEEEREWLEGVINHVSGLADPPEDVKMCEKFRAALTLPEDL